MSLTYAGAAFDGISVGLLIDAAFLVGLVGYAAWWAHELNRGVKVSRLSMAVHLLVYGSFAFWAWTTGIYALVQDGFESSRYLDLWRIVSLLPLIPLVLATFRGFGFTRRRLTVVRSDSGRWTYRGAAAAPVVWAGLYLTHFALEELLLKGYSVFSGPFEPGTVPTSVPPLTFGFVVMLIVSLYLVSFGFFIGFSLAVWATYHRTRKSFEQASANPGGQAAARSTPTPQDKESTGWASAAPPTDSPSELEASVNRPYSSARSTVRPTSPGDPPIHGEAPPGFSRESGRRSRR